MPDKEERSGFWGNPGWLGAMVAVCSVVGSLLANLSDHMFASGSKDQEIHQIQNECSTLTRQHEILEEAVRKSDQLVIERFGRLETRLGVLEDRTSRR